MEMRHSFMCMGLSFCMMWIFTRKLIKALSCLKDQNIEGLPDYKDIKQNEFCYRK